MQDMNKDKLLVYPIKAASKVHMITVDEYNRGLENQPITFKIQLWLCKHLEWHKPSDSMGFDGCSFTSICKICGKEILMDSQGNWF